MEHKSIKPSILFASLSQLVVFLIYLGIAYSTIKVMSILLGFDIIGFFLSAFKDIDVAVMPIILESIEDPIIEMILVIFPGVLIFFINLVNQGIIIEEDKFIVKKGFIKINKEEHLFSDINKFEIKKDFGFLNSGSVEIFTKQGENIEIEYLTNLKKVSSFLNGIIEKNTSEVDINAKNSAYVSNQQ